MAKASRASHRTVVATTTANANACNHSRSGERFLFLSFIVWAQYKKLRTTMVVAIRNFWMYDECDWCGVLAYFCFQHSFDAFFLCLILREATERVQGRVAIVCFEAGVCVVVQQQLHYVFVPV